MAKKKKTSKNKKKKASTQQSEEKFEDLCTEFRKYKIQEKKAKKGINKYRPKLVDYAIKHNLAKGDYHGIKLMHKYRFSTKNIEIAEENEIVVPTKRSYQISNEIVEKLIKEGHLKEGEYEVADLPILKELEEIFEENEIEGVYELSYALGLSTME